MLTTIGKETKQEEAETDERTCMHILENTMATNAKVRNIQRTTEHSNPCKAMFLCSVLRKSAIFKLPAKIYQA